MMDKGKCESAEKPILRELMQVPGVGKRIAQDLYDLGYRSVKQLRDQDPEEMYQRLCEHQGTPVDRCMLYVFRCAVYFASNDECAPELLQWWNWKDVR